MGKRTLFLGAAIVLLLVLAWPSLRSETASALDLFFWLLAILVVVGVVLWPSTGRDQKAELKLERRNWADRVEFGDSKHASDASVPPDNSAADLGRR